MIQALSRNATRLQRLTDDILDVARIESETLMLKIEPLDLDDLISNIIEDYRNQVEKNKDNVGLNYEPKTNDSKITVEADRARLIQVISNLLDNAIKFTKSGGSIYVAAERKHTENGNKKQEIIIRIKDGGKGIDSEIMPRLFTKFATKSETGTGLGLYICKSIIEVHGGRIWAENNTDGNGATFSFTLPISQKQQHQQEQEPRIPSKWTRM